MVNVDFDELEQELDVVIPNIYRLFIDAVNAKKYDLQRHGIYDTTSAVLKGNWKRRLELADSAIKWQDHFFDFGVNDGCGNYFFLQATDEDDDVVQLWSHDPAGIEDVETGTEFFMALLEELEADFKGPNQYRFQGNGTA